MRTSGYFRQPRRLTFVSADIHMPGAVYAKQRLEIKLPRKPSLSQIFRSARIDRGLSVAEVASQVGVSAPCVYFWEMGRTRPRDANLTMLCKALKLPIRATRELAGY